MDILRIAVGGSSANPPHFGHRKIIESLLDNDNFDLVYWIVSGDRNDKNNLIEARHRVNMTKMMLDTIPKQKKYKKLKLITSDANRKNTPSIIWLNRIQKKHPNAKLFWYTGADVIIPKKQLEGKCEIEARWFSGKELLRKYNFLVFPRKGIDGQRNLMFAPNIYFLKKEIPEISSSAVRDRISQGKRADELVGNKIAAYLDINKLYQK